MRKTQNYRDLLEKQRKEFQSAFDRLFDSVTIILDNVDNLYEMKRIEQKVKNDEKIKTAKQNDEINFRK